MGTAVKVGAVVLGTVVVVSVSSYAYTLYKLNKFTKELLG